MRIKLLGILAASLLMAACSNEEAEPAAAPEAAATSATSTPGTAPAAGAAAVAASAEANTPDAMLRADACELLADDVLRKAGVEVPGQVNRMSQAAADGRQAFCSVQWFKPDAELIAEQNAASGATPETAEPAQVVSSLRLYRDFDSIEGATAEFMRLKGTFPGESTPLQGLGEEGVWSALSRSMVLRDGSNVVVVGFYASADAGRDQQAAATIAQGALEAFRARTH